MTSTARHAVIVLLLGSFGFAQSNPSIKSVADGANTSSFDQQVILSAVAPGRIFPHLEVSAGIATSTRLSGDATPAVFMTKEAIAAELGTGSPEPAMLLVNPQPLIAPLRKSVRVEPNRIQVLAWRGLVVGEHSAAAFDGWSTRAALSSGNGYERNPLMRPFANSNAIYPMLQIAPFGFDYLGHRFLRSNHVFLRRAWWVPQADSMKASLC